MNKFLAFLLIVILGCLFQHVLLALVLVAALGWVALDIFLGWALHKGLEERRREERERQMPAADRFQAWLDSNQRRQR